MTQLTAKQGFDFIIVNRKFIIRILEKYRQRGPEIKKTPYTRFQGIGGRKLVIKKFDIF